MENEQRHASIETQELRLVDSEGKVRARLFMDEGEPKLSLFTKAGIKRLGLGLLSGGEVGLALYDNYERLHIAMIVTADGMPEITVIDRQGKESELSKQRESKPPSDDFDIVPEVKKRGMKWLLKK
jgi:hypothetical protein